MSDRIEAAIRDIVQEELQKPLDEIRKDVASLREDLQSALEQIAELLKKTPEEDDVRDTLERLSDAIERLDRPAAATAAGTRPPAANLWENIQQLRLERRISHDELAKKTGIKKDLLLDLEGGRRKRIPKEDFEKLAEALGVTYDQLLGREPVPVFVQPVDEEVEAYRSEVRRLKDELKRTRRKLA